MPALGTISRHDLIQALRRAGFGGPYTGGKHAFMVKGSLTLTVPNPHQGEIGRDLLARILRQAGISGREWEAIP
jgi:predicted RNA binding protein YcfA (HicA-like mRNA interferase family)